MAHVFHPPPTVIERVVDKMKEFRILHPDAKFNYNAPDGLRREVAYRDTDFMHHLGGSDFEAETVDAALAYLKSLALVSESADYDRAAFALIRQEIKSNFTGSWTSITPVMERFMYMLTSVKRPQRMVEFGCFWGNTLAWFASPCIGNARVYRAEKIYGIDHNVAMVEQARANFAKLSNCEAVELFAEDAQASINHIEGPFDFIYIEAKEPETPDLYLTLLKAIYDRLPQGAWVIAHDVFDYQEAPDLHDYMAWVRDPAHFSHSIAFDIDACGMELSIK